MRNLTGMNVVVADLETERSSLDCRICGQEEAAHGAPPSGRRCPTRGFAGPVDSTYTPIGWDDRVSLSLSIGCYFSYKDMSFHWFDKHNLAETMRFWVEHGTLLVSWNGLSFDFPLMCEILRQADVVETSGEYMHQPALTEFCYAFQALYAAGYDILAACWQSDPQGKFVKGLYSLDAISRANGYGVKSMDGAMAPRLWAQGRYAEVIEYNLSDVMKTKGLFEQIVATGTILRGDGQPLVLSALPLLPMNGVPA